MIKVSDKIYYEDKLCEVRIITDDKVLLKILSKDPDDDNDWDYLQVALTSLE